MNAKKWTALLLFALAVGLNLVGCYFDIPILSRVSKPVLMPLVLLNALLALSDTIAPKWLGVLLTFALAFHCAGDVFLMIEGFPFFVTGLTCFLIGHLFYISIFFKKGLFKGDKLLWSILTGIAVVVIPLVLINVLEFEGPIKYAVFIYGIVLLFVSFSGLWGVFNKKSGAANPVYWLCFLGGLAFIFSDILVAWRSLLGNSFPRIGFVIMSTYILAECLIVTSIVRPYLKAK